MPTKQLILLAAHLEVCPSCQCHANILLPGGRGTRHFASKRAGRSVVRALVAGSHIDATEEKFLLEAIEVSSLHDDLLFEEEVSSPEEAFEDPATGAPRTARRHPGGQIM